MAIIFVIHSPDKTSYWNVCAADNSVGHRISFITVESHLVAVIHVEVTTLERILRSSQICCDTLVVDSGNTTLNFSRVGDKSIISYAAILLSSEAIVIEKCL